MNQDPSPERRLERIEERLERLEREHEEARKRERRRRRQDFWTRIALALVVGAAYLLYLRYVTTIA